MNDFIAELSAYNIGTRQTFYNAVRVGKVLFDPILGLNERIDRLVLYSNYSKLHLVSRLLSIKPEHRLFEIISEVEKRFANDSCKDFERFIQETVAENRGSVKPKQTSANPRTKEKIPPSLTGARLKIYSCVHAGLEVKLCPGIDPTLCGSIETSLKELRKKYYMEHNSQITEEITRRFNNPAFAYLEHLDSIWQGFIKDETIFSLGSARMFSPEILKKALRTNLKTETDFQIVQAYLIDRINTEHRLQDEFGIFNVERASDFATRYFGIGLSQYKRLKRIGKNLELFKSLKGELNIGGINILEKIYFLDQAISNHDGISVVRAFNHLPAKLFREFARDPSYSIPENVLDKRHYKLSVPIINEYEALSSKHSYIGIIGYKTKDELSRVNAIITASLPGNEHQRKHHHYIAWDNVAQVASSPVDAPLVVNSPMDECDRQTEEAA